MTRARACVVGVGLGHFNGSRNCAHTTSTVRVMRAAFCSHAMGGQHTSVSYRCGPLVAARRGGNSFIRSGHTSLRGSTPIT
jgi:hypothetical protein